jgi:Ankyrin repeats (3 copies)
MHRKLPWILVVLICGAVLYCTLHWRHKQSSAVAREQQLPRTTSQLSNGISSHSIFSLETGTKMSRTTAAKGLSRPDLFMQAVPNAPANQLDLDQQLVDAINHNNSDLAIRLINQGANSNAIDHDTEMSGLFYGTPALWYASDRGLTSVVNALLDHGAHIDAINDYEITPLSAAACGNSTDTVALLVQRGAAIEYRDWLGRTPLIQAASCGKTDIVKFLMAHGAALNARDREGRGALEEVQARLADPWSKPEYAYLTATEQVLTSPDCARFNCKNVDNPPVGKPSLPPAVLAKLPQMVPASQVKCDLHASPVNGAIKYEPPPDMPPMAGDPLRVTMFTSAIGQVRVLALSNGKVIGSVDSTTPVRAILASYVDGDFHIVPELCVQGKWQPITNALSLKEKGTILGIQNQPDEDYFSLSTNGGDNFKPTVATIPLTLEFSFPEPNVSVNVQAQHNCHNYLVAEEVTNYGSVSIHVGNKPYPAQVASVKMTYDGNYHQGDDNPWAPSNPTRLDQFPYSGDLSKTGQDTSYVVVSDQNRSILIPVCSGFRVDGAAVLADGRRYYGSVHANE